MEIAIFIVVPKGSDMYEVVADPETEVFFNWQDADDAAKAIDSEAKVFQATTTFYEDDFSPVD
jgi:hypothetical protein